MTDTGLDLSLRPTPQAKSGLADSTEQAAAPLWQLAGIGVLMAAVFYLGFARRYSFAEFGQSAAQSIAILSSMSVQSAVLYIAGFALLFGAYWYGARQKWPTSRAFWLTLGGVGLLVNVALLPLYPVDASDLYDNIIRGRMSAVYGLNPLRDVPDAIPSDPFYRFAAWHSIPSAYGPGWELVAGLTSKLAGDDYAANLIAFKLTSIAGYALAALLIALTLRRVAPERAAHGTYLFTLNPLLLYVTAGTGHNDSVMVACMAFSVYCLVRRWYVASTLGALLGTLVKFIPILLVPLIALIALRDSDRRGRIRYVIGSVVLGAALVTAIYLPFGLNTLALPTDRVGQMFTGSFGAVARQALEAYTSSATAAMVVKYAVVGLFGLFYVWQLASLIRRRDPLDFVRAAAAILLFYLMVSATWFMAWYVIWGVALVALLPDSPIRRLTLVFSYLVTWESLVYNYVTLRYDGWAPLPWRDLLPVLSYMGVAWLYVAWLLVGRLRKSRAVHEAVVPL